MHVGRDSSISLESDDYRTLVKLGRACEELGYFDFFYFFQVDCPLCDKWWVRRGTAGEWKGKGSGAGDVQK